MNGDVVFYLFVVASLGIFFSEWLFDLLLIFFLNKESRSNKFRFVWLRLSHKRYVEHLSQEGKDFLSKWRTSAILVGTTVTILISAHVY